MASDTTLEDVVCDPGQWVYSEQSRLLAELAELRRKAAAWDRLYTLAESLSLNPQRETLHGLYQVLRQRMDYELKHA